MKINLIKIKKEMARNGWNNTKLANVMGVSKQRLNYVLSPRYKSNTFRTIDLIAKALSLDSRDLVK
jgi:DNA-binding Xre family transcriptional regulator